MVYGLLAIGSPRTMDLGPPKVHSYQVFQLPSRLFDGASFLPVEGCERFGGQAAELLRETLREIRWVAVSYL